MARLQLEVASHKATLVLSTQSGRQSAPALHVLFQTTWQLGRLSTQPKSAWVGPPALGASPPPSPAPMHPYPPSSSLLSDGDSGLRPSPSGRQSAAQIPSYPPFTSFRSDGHGPEGPSASVYTPRAPSGAPWFLLCRSTWQRRKPSAPQKSASWPSAPCASWRGRLRRALR